MKHKTDEPYRLGRRSIRLCLRYDQSNVRIYVNGSLDSTHANTIDCRDTASELVLGGDIEKGRWFDGFVDEVGIWKRALTLSEAQALNTGAQP